MSVGNDMFENQTETMQQKSYNRETLHGGDLEWAKSVYGGDTPDWIDLSTGINPVPYPVPDIPDEDWHRLPGAEEERQLLQNAADYYGVDGSNLVAAPGTQALIQLLPYLFPTSNVAILGPTYSEHEICWRRAGHTVRVVEDLASIPEEANVVILVNPNNPTATLHDIDAIGRVQRDGRLLVIDEAFMDVFPKNSSTQLKFEDNCIILKSFGKFFGLAGVRLGFAIGSHELITNIQERLGPWSVSGPAMRIGSAAYSDRNWIKATRDRLSEDSHRLRCLLEAAGTHIVGSADLFVTIHSERSKVIFEALLQQHILTRVFPDQPNWIRFGLPANDAQWQRLEDCLKDLT